MVFPVVMYGWELDHKEGWAPKKWCFWIVVLEKILESLLDRKEIVNPKGNQLWIFIEKADAEAEAPILWPPNAKSRLIGKDPDAGKEWEQEKEATEDEMIGWHHRLSRHEFEQTLGDSEGQESLACCSSQGCRVGHTYQKTTLVYSSITHKSQKVETNVHRLMNG